MTDIWNKQFEQYNTLINSSYTNEDFLLTGKMDLLHKSLSISPKITFNKLDKISKDDTPLTSSAELLFKYKLSSKTYFSILNKENENVFNFNFPIIRKVYLNGKVNFNEDEKKKNTPSEFYIHFDLNNSKSFTGLNLLEYNIRKSIIPNVFALYYIQNQILYEKNITYGIFSGYSIPKKSFKFHKLLLGLKGEKVNTIFDISFDKNLKDETKFDKIIKLRSFVDLNTLFKLGGDTEYNTNLEMFNSRLLFTYNPKKNTVIKGKYEKNDSLITLCISHQFRGLLKLGITGKFNFIDNDSLFKIPKFKSKYGYSIEINDTVI